MKILFSLFIGLSFFAFAGQIVSAQSRKITIILLRHAEKDTSPGADRRDPELTAAGRRRAERLIEVVKKYKPDLIYSTFYRRTKSTVLPLAETLDARYRIPIRQYDLSEPEKFADELLQSKARAIVVVGHNNTTPELANLLIKQNKYKELADNEYDKIWIIEIKRNKRNPNKIKEKVVQY